MAATLTLTLDDQVLSSALVQAAAALGDLTPLMDQIGAGLLATVQDRFVSGEAPDGSVWPQSRAARERGGPTLVRDGYLRDSITYAAEADAVEVGSNLTYAAIHQFGGTIKPVTAKALRFRLPNGAWVTAAQVTLPARPYLGIGPQDELQITEIATAYLERAVGP